MLSSAECPLLFDPLSRTLCVESDQNLSFLQPSNRIATNYTPSAGLLMMHTSALASGSASKASVSGLVFYGESPSTRARQDGATAGTSAGVDAKRAFPRAVEPGVLWPGAAPDSPSRSHQTQSDVSQDARTSSSSSDVCALALTEPARDAKSEERYFAYISSDDRLVARHWLTPIAPDLITRIVASAVKYLTEPPSGHMERILASAQGEFIANYYVSAKKAIIDYTLLRAASRRRLGIAHGTPSHATLPAHWTWGASDGPNGCLDDLKLLAERQHAASRASGAATQERAMPRSLAAAHPLALQDNKTRRRQRVKAKLTTLYLLSDPIVRTLQAVWHELEPQLLLVKLPSVEALSASSAPLDLHAFEHEQLQHAASVRAYLMEHWYRRVRSMVEDALRAESIAIGASAAGSAAAATAIEHRVRHLLDVVSTLMSLQLRALIVKSIEAYIAFFELFDEAASSTRRRSSAVMPDASAVTSSAVTASPPFAGLLLALTLQNGDVQVWWRTHVFYGHRCISQPAHERSKRLTPLSLCTASPR